MVLWINALAFQGRTESFNRLQRLFLIYIAGGGKKENLQQGRESRGGLYGAPSNAMFLAIHTYFSCVLLTFCMWQHQCTVQLHFCMCSIIVQYSCTIVAASVACACGHGPRTARSECSIHSLKVPGPLANSCRLKMGAEGRNKLCQWSIEDMWGKRI